MAKRFDSTLVNDVTMAGFLVGVIALMILPLPTMLIDALLAINLTVSILLLMTVLFIPDALSLSTFPSLLLFTTLFRLALNIASTKAILLHADAGHLIESFGQLVVGGNLVVGIVVFLVITIVQFIVIAKGSERVAEVGARFTLDALPGKQMSIDADLRAGLLTPDEAKRKRAHLGMESMLHGGMDGAMKFVKGDAIAGLIITMVNILAGVVVGIMYHNMTAGEAANRFAVLSIGDAMVSQIPALFICMAAGVLTTRVTDEHKTKPTSLGEDMTEQLTRNPRSMYLAAALTIGFGFIPGFPLIPFALLAGGLVFGGHFLTKKRQRLAGNSLSKPIAALMREGAKGDAPSIQQKAPEFAKPLSIRMSEALGKLIDAERLNAALNKEREGLQSRLGLPFPGAAMWVTTELSGLRYEVLINDVPVAQPELPGRMLLILDPQSPLAASAQSHGPALGNAVSLWIAPESVPASQREGVCIDVEQVIAREVMGMLQRHAHLFMGVQEVQWVMERSTPEYPGLVAEVQKIMPLQRMAEVLRRLLEEQVPIRNIRSIFESLIVWGPKEKDLLLLTEYVRSDLGRYLAHEATSGQRHLSAILLDPDIEQAIRGCIKPTPAGNYLAMSPDDARDLTERIAAVADTARQPGVALVTSMDIRRYVKKMIESRLDWLRVYSFQELGTQVELRPIGRVS
ncbi:type III secretion system export apparatus subunit SctV [Paracidovorax valerianellae]|uniref:Type III secretion protein V n=1 Tax=Paracidovorax valerianellae TaxID=187868 RepID=A0A1G7B3M7_9BURK|nr:type III secretion system export apparatus subunit SctV [Paracidovorax valerianellae]MDA8445681.1 type III secretion system export apparatus subunit SctV [Paracidovorax valerianellae]SDE20835.1 type III secretion protein V [Paracidovorax valerianellae]